MLGLGLPAMLVHFASTIFLEATGRPLASMVVMALANVLNVLLNGLFMLGWLGMPEMGAEGAALATTLCRVFLAAALGGYVLSAVDRERYGTLTTKIAFSPILRRLFRVGLPFGLAQFVETAAFQTVAIFAGWLGTITVAAYAAIMNLTALLYMSSMGLAVATSVRVGNAVGRGDPAGARVAAMVGLCLTLGMTLMFCLPILTAPRGIASVYLTESAALVMATGALWAVGLVVVFDGMQVVLLNVLRGASDTWMPTLLHLVACAVVLAPVAWILGIRLELGLVGLMLGIAAGLAMATFLLFVRTRRVLAREVARL